MARTWSWIASTLFAALPVVAAGCQQVVCGEGTAEEDGACVPADEDSDPTQCGPGTELGQGGVCVPSEPTVCDPDTTVPVVDEATGVVTCVGIGGDSCSPELQCPAPSAGKLTLCGRLVDTETGQVIEAPDATGAECDPEAPTASGPCSLRVRFYDALVFQMDPQGATPLAGEVMVDDCGRYRATDVSATSFGFVGAAVDDANNNGAADVHLLTGVATADAMAVPARGFSLYVTRKTTEALWDASGSPPGDGFAEEGVLAMIFRHRGQPVAGVRARRGTPPNVIPADDFYFSDPGTTLTTVAPAQDTTGANGTVLVVNSGAPATHDGVGAEPAGCRWPAALAATIPGVVFVQLKDAEANAGGPCP